jgi:DNA-directed RNA polymerase beta subunit
MLSNLGLGKVAEKLGKPIKVTGFVEGSSIKKTQELMKKHKVPDLEEVYDPVSGTKTKVLVGPLFINRLVHIAEDKLSDRSQGVGYDWNEQPTKAKDESAKRLGNLSTSALLSHNATEVLKDIATVRATRNDEFWRNIKMGLPAPANEAINLLKINGTFGAGAGRPIFILRQNSSFLVALTVAISLSTSVAL